MKKFLFPLPLFFVLPAVMLIIPAAFGIAAGGKNTGPNTAVSYTEGVVSPSSADSDVPETVTVLNTETGKTEKAALEDYLVGVLAAEMPAAYHTEALKAQAVAARSYILSRMSADKKAHENADICTDPAHCKGWISREEMAEKWRMEDRDFYMKKIENAVSATQGEYMVYDGEAIEAFFFARSGGRTENPVDVWGGERPYLKSVPSDGDILSPDCKSEVRVSFEDFKSRLKPLNPDAALSDGAPLFGEITRSEGGAVKTVNLGGQVFKGSEIRNIFGLKSANFTMSTNESGEVVFSVSGSGHGVGMSQFGANHMAETGKKYTEILSHYYTNIQIVKK